MLALIAARGGSKRLPRKHILPLAGLPLIAHSVRAACAAKLVDRVVVTTDDPEIADAARAAGAEVPFMRPKELATDTVPARAACLHALERLAETEGSPRSAFAMIQPTCPLISAADIDAVIAAFGQPDTSGAVTIAPANQHLEGIVVLEDDGFLRNCLKRDYGTDPKIMPSQMHGARYYVTGAAMAMDAPRLRCDREYIFTDAHVRGVMTPAERAVDIDTALDFDFAEFLLTRRAAQSAAGDTR